MKVESIGIKDCRILPMLRRRNLMDEKRVRIPLKVV